MSIFNSILNKLGMAKPAPQPVPKPAPRPAPQPAPVQPLGSLPKAPISPLGPIMAEAMPQPPIAVTAVDVMSKLNELAAANPQKLNWKVSIVDLMKLLGLDSSFAVRKELAVELGCPAEKMADSAQMNMWLHKTVLQKLAENGGNIPKELLT